MINATTPTHDRADVPSQREESPTRYSPDGLTPRARQRLRLEMNGEGPAALLTRAWEGAPVDDEHAYVQLLGGCIHYDHDEGGVAYRIRAIENYVPDRALERLPSLTSDSFRHNKDVLLIGKHKLHFGGDDWSYDGTEVILGPVAKRLSEMGGHTVDPKAMADATSRLVSNGDTSLIRELFVDSRSPTPEDPAGAAPTGTGDAAEADDAAAPTGDTDGPLPIDLTITPRGDAKVTDIRSIAKGRFNGVTVAFGGWYSSITRPPDLITGPPDRPHSAATKARVDLMPDEEIEALLDREPDGSVVKYLPAPDPLYDRIIDWRPQLEEYEPCAAINQKVLLDYHRDEDWYVEGDCTGVPIPHTFVFACFGMAPRTGWNRGLTAAMLLEVHRRTIDERFRHSGWNHDEGKARVVAGHGIPDDIIAYAKHSLFSPDMEDSWTYIIGGKDAGNRHNTGPLRDKRRDELEETEDPVIEPPEAVKEMQEYLNGLDQQFFSNGGYGKLRPEQLAKASEAASTFRREQRRDQANRKLVQMRTHPQPLYDFCDRFPRLKADPYNQAMNLPAELRHPLYGDRDYELDLDKAHLACYVPVVRREGIEVPKLDKCLAANLEDDTDLLERGDLWWDLAFAADTDQFDDLKTLRTAVKRAYSAVYGSGMGNMFYRIMKFYADLTGHWPGRSTDPIRPIMEHPLMEELFETRDKLEAIITDRGGLKDANGCCIPLSKWDGEKPKDERWRGCMAYVNCTFEQEIMSPIFREAKKEMERDGKTRFKVWLYQGDGVTIRIHRDYAHEPRIARLQSAVKERADELGVPTRLTVDWPTDVGFTSPTASGPPTTSESTSTSATPPAAHTGASIDNTSDDPEPDDSAAEPPDEAYHPCPDEATREQIENWAEVQRSNYVRLSAPPGSSSYQRKYGHDGTGEIPDPDQL